MASTAAAAARRTLNRLAIINANLVFVDLRNQSVRSPLSRIGPRTAAAYLSNYHCVSRESFKECSTNSHFLETRKIPPKQEESKWVLLVVFISGITKP